MIVVITRATGLDKTSIGTVDELINILKSLFLCLQLQLGVCFFAMQTPAHAHFTQVKITGFTFWANESLDALVKSEIFLITFASIYKPFHFPAVAKPDVSFASIIV